MIAPVQRKLARSVILLLCLLSPFVVWRLWLAHDVNSRLSAIRAAGLPTNGEELNKWYAAVPERENAALALTQAFSLLCNYPDSRSNQVWEFKMPGRGHALLAEQIELLEAYVAMNSAALEKANEAVLLPASRYPIDCSLCANTLLPHLAQIKSTTLLNQYKAVLAIQAGNPEKASASVKTMLGLARTLDQEPILISQLVRFAVVKLAVSTLERRANAGALDSGEVTNLVAAIVRTDATNRVARALVGERAIYATYFRMTKNQAARILAPAKGGEEEADSGRAIPRKRPLALSLIGIYDLDFDYFLVAMGKSIELASLPPPENLAADNHFSRAGAVANKRYRTVSSVVLSGFAGAVAREIEGVACLRLARTSLAVEQFRNQNSRLPETLDELTPAFLAQVPQDPFDGAPLRYRRLPKGYVLYSVDRDGHDDGGREKPEHKKSSDQNSYDLTFTVER